MMKTLDGLTIKRGDVCFVVAIADNGKYKPCRCMAHSQSQIYGIRGACQAECDRKNELNK